MNASGELSEPLLQETIAKEKTKIPASKAANNFTRLFIILPPTRDMTNSEIFIKIHNCHFFIIYNYGYNCN